MAGALLYLKPEFHLEATPALEGLVVASTLIGAVASVSVAGPAADWAGRKSMLCISGLLYSIAAFIMLWSPTVYILILSRVVVGLAIGLASTIAPILISESAPAEIRGQLATFPQLLGSSGLFFAYVMDFVLSLQPHPNWRFMLGFLTIPSVLYVFLCIFVLPESPRWLVSKGRMHDAKVVLQNLRFQEDVSGLFLDLRHLSLSTMFKFVQIYNDVSQRQGCNTSLVGDSAFDEVIASGAQQLREQYAHPTCSALSTKYDSILNDSGI